MGRHHAGHQGELALPAISPEKTLLYQLVVSVPILALAALLFGERIDAYAGRPVALGSLAYQTVGGRHHLRDLVRADRAILGEPAFGLHLPDAAVRRRGRPSGAGRAAHACFCGRRGAGGGGLILVNRRADRVI